MTKRHHQHLKKITELLDSRYTQPIASSGAAIKRINVPTDYGADLYHWIMVTPWRHLLAIMIGIIIFMNMFFALLYWFDMEGIYGAYSYLDCFFFSIQTSATIGYGAFHPLSTYCHMVVVVEAIFSFLLTAIFTGLVFSKFSRPIPRVIFSRSILMNQRNGVPTMMFRVANGRGNPILEAQVRVTLLIESKTLEGENFRQLIDIPLERTVSPIFILSWTVFHKITSHSPLADWTAETFAQKHARLIVNVMGYDGTLSQSVYSVHTYTHKDILWNTRFQDMLISDEQGQLVLDMAKLDHTYEIS